MNGDHTALSSGMTWLSMELHKFLQIDSPPPISEIDNNKASPPPSNDDNDIPPLEESEENYEEIF
jgi:hypothetical protein